MALRSDFPVRIDSSRQQGDQPITYLHGHDCLEIGYCHSGAGIFAIAGKVLPFGAGDVTVIGPSEFHLARSMPGTSSVWDWIYLDPLRLLPLPPPNLRSVDLSRLAGDRFSNVISAEKDPFLAVLVKELIAELRNHDSLSRDVTRGIVWTLMARLQRLAPKSRARARSGSEEAMLRVAPALSVMAEQYGSSLGIREWAQRCHCSQTNFRRLFHRAMGKSPHQYLTELRVRMAASRLQATDEKIVTIAYETGFTTLSSFNRAFKRRMRMTPRDWRRKKRIA
jgi:AraC-like DNA-binding protein